MTNPKYLNQDFNDFQDNFINDWFNELSHLDPTLQTNFSIFQDFIDLAKRLEKKIIFRLLESLKEFDTSAFSNEEFGKAFEYIIELNGIESSKSGLIRTPRDIIDLMVSILNPTVGDLYDPVCGTGGFLTQAKRISNNLNLFGSEINYRIARIAAMNLIMNGVETARIQAESCFNQLSNDTLYDYIIGDLPITGGVAGNQIEELIRIWNINLTKKNKGFGVFLLLSIAKLKYSGKAIFTVSESFLFRKGVDQVIKNTLLERDQIETIISLPTGILKPYTKGKASIIVLNNNKPDYLLDKIKFIDLSNQNEYLELGTNEISRIYNDVNENEFSQVVSKVEILQFNTLNPKYYTKESSNLRELLVSGSAKLLNELARLQGGKRLLNNEDVSQEYGTPYIRIENLERDVLDMYLSKESVKDYISTNLHEYDSSIIDKECILIGKIGDNLKPTYFKPTLELEKIIIHPNVVAIFPKTNLEISLEYLYYQLYSNVVKNQLEKYQPKSIVPFLTLSSLKELIILFPDFESQQKFIEVEKATIIAAERSRIDERIKKLGYKEQAEERELDVVRTITHQLRHKLTNLHSLVEKAISISKKRGLGGYKQYDEDDEILIPEPGFEEPENETLSSTLHKSKEKSLFLSKILIDVEKAITLDLTFEQVELVAFLKNICSEFESDGYFFDVSGDKVTVEVSKTHFVDLIQTLIENAQQHSFKEQRKVKRIGFKVKPDFNRGLILIEYSNNGQPISISQKEYVSILTRSKSSSGSGIGGYYINKIIEAHNGSLEVQENLKTGVRINIELPMSQNNYE
ncbi:N-6 DNA methylase [Flagellimonas flava]|uniref:N-6 DNA methylase n=1 Tax=Flagellimonas flava TaxID=570519 RepID=UPI003D653C8E